MYAELKEVTKDVYPDAWKIDKAWSCMPKNYRNGGIAAQYVL